MLVFCVLLFCPSFIAHCLTHWGFLQCMYGCGFPSCKIFAVWVWFRPSIQIFVPKWRCMLTGRCCHLRRLSFIVRPSCRGILDWFLASARCVVCGNLQQRPFTVSVSPCDWNGGAWNLIFIFLGTFLQGSESRFQSLLAQILACLSLAVMMYSRSHCLLSFFRVPQVHSKVALWMNALPILFTYSERTFQSLISEFPHSEGLHTCFKEHHTLKCYWTYCNSEWCWFQNTVPDFFYNLFTSLYIL